MVVNFIRVFLLVFASFVFLSNNSFAQGNEKIYSVNDAKKMLERIVYHDFRYTFYCHAQFDSRKKISPPAGFVYNGKYKNRALRMEWEHIVPVENFGRNFFEWRDGHRECIDNQGRAFKGRSCAEKMSPRFRLMLSDMHNLVPAIGAVNAARGNYSFVASLQGENFIFGECPIAIAGRKVAPPEYTRGQIARTYLYMESAYSEFSMSRQMAKLMKSWNAMYPPYRWECLREKRIHQLQGNSNKYVSEPCSRQ